MRASSEVFFNFKGNTTRPLELRFTARSVRLVERELGQTINAAVFTDKSRFSELASVLAWGGIIGGSQRDATIEQVDVLVEGYLQHCIANAEDKMEARGKAYIDILESCGKALVEASILEFNVFNEAELEKMVTKREEEAAKMREAEAEGAEALPEDPTQT